MDTARRPVRVWIDGCFDLFHFGHANACRQAKLMGDELVVGVHTDVEIERHKGPPVFNEKERYELVRSIKWVDEVVEAAPYVTTVECLKKYNCDFCVHGDDITVCCDGTDTYTHVKKAGMYKECKRTNGVSTTDIVGRMLLMTKDHHHQIVKQSHNTISDLDSNSPWTKSYDFLASSKRISQFANNIRDPKASDKVVYVDGGFDLFHIGHVKFLETARSHGDYLIVGLHDDKEINRVKGANYPIMNVHERLLSLLACKYVDEVLIGVSFTVPNELIKMLNVHLVVSGSEDTYPDIDGLDPYRYAKQADIYKQVTSGVKLSVEDILQRIMLMLSPAIILCLLLSNGLKRSSAQNNSNMNVSGNISLNPNGNAGNGNAGNGNAGNGNAGNGNAGNGNAGNGNAGNGTGGNGTGGNGTDGNGTDGNGNAGNGNGGNGTGGNGNGDNGTGGNGTGLSSGAIYGIAGGSVFLTIIIIVGIVLAFDKLSLSACTANPMTIPLRRSRKRSVRRPANVTLSKYATVASVVSSEGIKSITGEI
ncbi:hypothetical protein GJ496_006117 [Pomphorhynchus laevis]|nr:hypothetical protein GJ496_006117 [Pomphorhynchus laevis]